MKRIDNREMLAYFLTGITFLIILVILRVILMI